MKKFIVLILSAITLTATAQTITNKAFSAGFELAIPSNGVYNIGLGASAKFEVPIVAPVSLSLTGGFTTLFYKSNLFNSSRTPGAAGFVPLKAGLKAYLSQNFYAEGEAGTAIETNYGKQSSFAFSIGPGFIVPVNDNRGIDISFRYESWSGQLRQTALRFAYRFGR
ncbi:MAG: hypothetical protein JWP37_4178 [Mucilaginibacter sp.]|nr:hypothetical protein [Mucilaginibacter sp.]